MPPTISIIAAIDQNRGLGYQDKIPWHISTDFKHFKHTTSGHPIIMGRTTFESIGESLPGRDNIIITRQPDYQVKDLHIVNSLDEAINLAKTLDNQEIFIIGGGQIYQQALPLADKLYLTLVHGKFKTDTFFPKYQHLFQLQSEEHLKELDKLSNNEYDFTFQTLIRK